MLVTHIDALSYIVLSVAYFKPALPLKRDRKVCPMVWPFDKFSEQLQALEHSLATDRLQRQTELSTITQSLERLISDDRKQRQTEQANLLQALTGHRESTEASMTAKLSDVQQSLEASMRRLQLPADFAQMLRAEFASRMSTLEGNIQLLLQSFIAAQKEVQQLNTLLAQLPNELETLHTQFRSALSRDMALFKNELFHTIPAHVPYNDDLIEQLNREFAQLRTELLTALAARAPVTEPMPTLALASFDGQRPADEQVSERLVPIINAILALDTGYAAWVANRDAKWNADIDALTAQVQAMKVGTPPGLPPPLPQALGAEHAQVEQQTVVVEEQEL